MSGFLLVSYVALWGLFGLQFVLIILLYRQLGLAYVGTAEGHNRDGLAVGAQAPAFAATGLDGSRQSLEDFLGKHLLVVFGSTQCEPCQQLIPHLNAFASEHVQNLTVIFISQGTADENKSFAAEHGVKVPVLLAPDDRVMRQFDARVTPFAFLISPDGKVESKGLVNNRAHLDRFLEESRVERAAAPRAS